MDATTLSDHDKAMIAKSGMTIPGVTDTPAPNAAAGGNTEGNEPGNEPGQADGGQPSAATNTDNQAVRPEWCPEEFWNAESGVDTEGLAKRYAELAKPATPPVTPPADGTEPKPNDPPVEPPKTPDATFSELVELANADILNTELGGKLKEETYAAFEQKLGMSRETIDEFIEGQNAKAELTKMKVYSEVGGEDKFLAMFQWATADLSNYSQADREMFDKMMHSGKPEDAISAAKTLKARYEAAEGTQGEIVTPGGQSKASLPGYTSKEEVTAAMRDPRYKRDLAYQREVQAKLQATLDAGRDLFGNG